MTIPTLIALLAPIVGFVQRAKPVVAEPKVAPDPRSLDDFISWLETQKPAREYDWYDACGCAMHYYLLEACGVNHPSQSGHDYETPFGSVFNYHKVLSPQPWTFGAALSRARAYRTQHRSVQS